MSERIRARYLIETADDPRRAVEVMAGEQSSGTFVTVPGETPELKERAGNELFNLPPEVTVVSNVKQDGKSVGILGDGEVVWHSDFSFKERPTAARMLVAMEVPPRELGGSTFFLSCYAAYDALPADLRRRVLPARRAPVAARPARPSAQGRQSSSCRYARCQARC